ncbi:MAG: hypothetical protein ACI4OE_07070 [Alphaproteobacteria bacterium]
MQIKTADGEKNVASKGLGGAALGLAIPGTVALVNQLSNGCGFLGGLFGNNAATTAAVSGNNMLVSALQSHIAKLESEKYTDGVGIEVYKEAIALSNKNDDKINANYKELAQAFAALDKQVAVNQQATVDNFAYLNNKIDTTKQEVLCYCNATFVPGKLVMPLSSICPEAMQRYNSWTAPTGTATQSASTEAKNA